MDAIMGMLLILLLPLSFAAWLVALAAVYVFTTTKWVYRMVTMDTFDVHASILDNGMAERTNTITHRPFHIIHNIYAYEHRWRWLIVSRRWSDFWVIDLWETISTDEYPYIAPWFYQQTFTTVDQAIGWINLTLVT